MERDFVMTYEEIYKSKLISAKECVDKHIHSGDKIFIGGLASADSILRYVVDKVKDGSLENISFHGNLITDDIGYHTGDIDPAKFNYQSFFFGNYERKGFVNHVVSYAPIHLSATEEYVKSLDIDVTVVLMTPPDEKGYCNIGPSGYNVSALKNTKKIIAQINKNIPRVFGSCHDFHVSEIDAFVECHKENYAPSSTSASLLDEKIASHILERIPDGACIQLGIGGTANAVGFGLKDKKHLGVHSEMFTDSMVYLHNIGAIDNSQKTFMPGRSVAGFAFNTEISNNFINKNPKVFFEPYHVVNNVNNIASNDNLMSINTAIAIDLTGQICSESIGMRQYSGTGGQVDYVRGATLSKGGKSFIAIPSVANTKNGPVSKINVSLPAGSFVTTLRTDVMYVVTEYGCVNLRFCDIPTRARKLISIAHPDFRDELTFEAKKYGYIY